MTTVRAAILIADDDAGLRTVLAHRLEMDGYDVVTVPDGASAVTIMQQRRFDVAITDLKMPGMDGIETTAAMKQIDPDLEVIIATGYASEDSAVSSNHNGVFDYITKPYDYPALTALLDRALAHRHMMGLYRSSFALTSALQGSDPMQVILEQGDRMMRSDAFGLVGQPQAPTQPAVFRSVGTEKPSQRLLSGLAQRAMQAGMPLRLSEGDTSLQTPSVAGLPPYTSALLYPLIVGGRSHGTLVFLRRANQPAFSIVDLQRGTVFATQVAMALEIGQLRNERRETTHHGVASRVAV